MAWLPVRLDLPDDPAVISIASECNISEDEVVGKLVRFWSWANTQSRDGHASGVTKSWIDRYVRRDGFADALEKAGWLVVDDGGIVIPNWDNWNGKSAKKRLQDARRQDSKRNRVTQESRSVRDESVTTEQKRTEEKKEQQQQSAGGQSGSAHSSDSVVVVSMLRSVGIAEGTAIDLAGEFGLDRVREVIALAENKPAANPAGYVVQALRQGWVAPKAREAAPVRTVTHGIVPSEEAKRREADAAHRQEVSARFESLTEEQLGAACEKIGGGVLHHWQRGTLDREDPGVRERVVGAA